VVFANHGRNNFELYVYRGIRLIGGRELVPVHIRFKRVLARSRYGYSKSVSVAGAKVEERSDEIPPWRGKNHDELIYFIVRVSVS
jgi:hypothetical protein